MDPMMLAAMVVAAVVTRAWEQSKRRATLGWQAAREGRDRRDTTRRVRRVDWARRVDTARQTGPRNPLWWPYAVGFVAACAARATVAAGQGAREGAQMGAAEGRRFGRAASERGWEWRRVWREYRHRTSSGEAPGDVVMEACPACGVYTTVTSLVPDSELGQVCGPCALWRAARPRCMHGVVDGYHNCPDCAAQLHNTYDTNRSCDGRCTNNGIGPEEATALGLCAECGGSEELVWNSGDEHGHSPCRECNPDGPRWKRSRVDISEVDRDHPGDISDPLWLSPDAARWSPNLTADDSETRQAGGVTPRRLNGELHFGADDDDPNGMRQCTRCDGSGVDPVGDETCRDCRTRQEQRNADHETRNGRYAPMDRAPVIQVLDARRSPNLAADDTSRYRILRNNQPGGTMTAALTTGTGEGYTDTVTTLKTLARQLRTAHDTAQRLGDQLTADELDNDTLTYLTDMMDELDAVVSVTESAARHVQQRHEPVAEAVTSAGGARNVARPAWYDDV